MKKALITLSILVLSFCASQSYGAMKVRGGEIIYEWLSDSTYRFFVKVYINCKDTNGITTFPICYYSPCDSSGFSQTMQRWPVRPSGPIMPSPFLPKTMCDSPASQVYGFYAFWFYSNVTLSSKCPIWRAFVSIDSRDTSFNLANSRGKTLHLEAMLNTTSHGKWNSSPYFDNAPPTSFYLDTPSTYNYQVVDPNGDSMAYQIVQPLAGAITTGCADLPGPLAFRTLGLPINTTTNPFPTGNTFSMNSSNGAMTFTPKYPGVMVLATRLLEYRNGVLIGSIMRDVSFTIPGTPTEVPEVPASANKATIYPNPTNTNFTVAGVNGAELIEIISSVGEVVYRTAIQPGSASLTLNEDFPTGLYFVKISGGGRVQTLRLAVME
jgi:hypothetical protein